MSSAIACALTVGSTGKRDIVGNIDRSRFELGRKSISLLERLHLQSIDGIEHAVELIVQLGFVPEVEIAGQHQVYGSIKVGLGRLQLARVVVRHAALIRHFDCVDQGLYLGTGGWRWQWSQARLRGRQRASAPAP